VEGRLPAALRSLHQLPRLVAPPLGYRGLAEPADGAVGELRSAPRRRPHHLSAARHRLDASAALRPPHHEKVGSSDMKRALALLLGLLVAMPLLAVERQRYLVASPKGAASVSKLRLTTNSAEISERHVRTFRNIDAFAADLTAEEAADLRTSGGLLVEPIVTREADGLGDLPVFSTRVRADSLPDGTDVPQVTPWGLTMVHAPDVWV